MPRSLATEQNYRMRAVRIAEAENAAAGRRLSPIGLAHSVKARKLSPSAVRLYRNALVFTMTDAARCKPEHAASLAAAIAILRDWHAQPGSEVKPKA